MIEPVAISSGETSALIKELISVLYTVRRHTVINPDSKQLQAAFEDFVDQYGYSESTRLLFYFSGHGHTLANNTKGYLVPTDARYRYVADKMKMVAGHHFASYSPLANILL